MNKIHNYSSQLIINSQSSTKVLHYCFSGPYTKIKRGHSAILFHPHPASPLEGEEYNVPLRREGSKEGIK